jgi:hypothetical protein
LNPQSVTLRVADELRKGGDFCGSSLVRVVDEHGNKVFNCIFGYPFCASATVNIGCRDVEIDQLTSNRTRT